MSDVTTKKYEQPAGFNWVKMEKAPISTCCVLSLLAIMSDLDDFLAEQEARMSLQDEPFDDYIARRMVAMDK